MLKLADHAVLMMEALVGSVWRWLLEGVLSLDLSSLLSAHYQVSCLTVWYLFYDLLMHPSSGITHEL